MMTYAVRPCVTIHHHTRREKGFLRPIRRNTTGDLFLIQKDQRRRKSPTKVRATTRRSHQRERRRSTDRHRLFLFFSSCCLVGSDSRYYTMLSSFSRSSSTAIRRQAVRSMSDAAHRPPLSLHGINARYANATYTCASKAGTLEQVEAELAGLANSAKTNPAFASFLANPLIPRNEKTDSIEKLLSGAKVSPITLNLCSALAGNAKLNELPKVAATYMKLMKAKRGEVDATIISAEPLSKKQSDQIAAAIKATSADAKDVVISSQVDPTIIGGIQIQIGDQFLDLSVKSRIEELARTPI